MALLDIPYYETPLAVSRDVFSAVVHSLRSLLLASGNLAATHSRKTQRTYSGYSLIVQRLLQRFLMDFDKVEYCTEDIRCAIQSEWGRRVDVVLEVFANCDTLDPDTEVSWLM